MIFQFYFKKMSSSEFLKDLSKKKLTDVAQRYVGLPGSIHMTFQHVRNEHSIHCRLQSWEGQVVHASCTCDNMYAAVDLVAHKVEAQLARQKIRAQRKSRIQPLSRLHRPLRGQELQTEDAELDADAWPDSPRAIH